VPFVVPSVCRVFGTACGPTFCDSVQGVVEILVDTLPGDILIFRGCRTDVDVSGDISTSAPWMTETCAARDLARVFPLPRERERERLCRRE
jgi:hypothetical protein